MKGQVTSGSHPSLDTVHLWHRLVIFMKKEYYSGIRATILAQPVILSQRDQNIEEDGIYLIIFQIHEEPG